MYHHGFRHQMYDLGGDHEVTIQRICSIACTAIVITTDMIFVNFEFVFAVGSTT